MKEAVVSLVRIEADIADIADIETNTDYDERRWSASATTGTKEDGGEGREVDFLVGKRQLPMPKHAGGYIFNPRIAQCRRPGILR